jgi:hypothetical protein
MGRTLDHYICPKCKNNFQTVGSVNEDDRVECSECGTIMDIYLCNEWVDKCDCPVEKESKDDAI